MQAFEAAVARGAANPERQLGTKPSLLGGRIGKARRELAVGANAFAPALDSSGCLEPRDRCDEVRARQPERRRERGAVFVVGRLLGDGRAAERAANGYAAKGARPAAELTRDDRELIHRPRR